MDYKKIQNAEIEISAVSSKQYPDQGLPEIALSGRSNVGKSSFINSMLNKKKLARTSSKPGKTRTLNFFNVESEIMFVDVPGYGYAKVSKGEQNKWGQMMDEYFATREELVLAILLVDLRHKPTEQDQQMYTYLRYFDLPILVIGTKSDKVKNSQMEKQISQIIETLDMDPDDMFTTYSSETKENRDIIWETIIDFTRDE